MFTYTDRVFRPPAEGDSLILQLAVGCPHNRCRFCAMYKGVPYHALSPAAATAYIRAAAAEYPAASRLFLADGDLMHLPFDHLRTIFAECQRAFPRLARVGLYANASSLAAKTADQLAELRSLKLSTAYVGLETGDDELLRMVGKQENSQTTIRAVHTLQATGAKASVMVLLGLGGQAGSARHIAATAEVLNAMQPRLLAALRLVDVPGTRMHDGYRTLSEYDSVRELRELLAALDLAATVFAANHVSIPYPLTGRLPRDRHRLLDQLDAILASGRLDRHTPGRQPLFL